MRDRRLRATRLIAASAMLAAALGGVEWGSPARALGPVVAITPDEVSHPIYTDGVAGNVYNPVLSGRGETAGVYEDSGPGNGWAQFDVAGVEQMTWGSGITVSGNGCMSLSAVPSFIIGFRQSASDVFVVNDRCRGIVDREIYRNDTGIGYSGQSQMALSHDGRYAVIAVPTGEEAPDVVLRIDTEAPNPPLVMPFPNIGCCHNALGDLGLDISDDGRVVVATYYTFVDDQFPHDVWAWDVPSNTVTPVGPVDGGGASAYPSISGNGRYVSFTSSRPLLGGEAGMGPWVYVADRANGSFVRVSGALPSAYHTSITRDGSQVAFAVGPPNCQYNTRVFWDIDQLCPAGRIDVAYSATPGFASGFSSETISVDAGGSPAPGLHVQPALSGNGRWVAWASTAGPDLVGPHVFGRHALMRRRDPGLAIDPLTFDIVANSNATLAATVRNTGRTSVSLDRIVAAPGARFAVVGGGTCVGGSLLPPGATCTVNVRFSSPNDASETTGTLTVEEFGYDPISASGRLVGRSTTVPPPTNTTTLPPGTETTTTRPNTTGTTTSTTAPPGTVTLTADPTLIDYGQVPFGIGTPLQTITVTNTGTASTALLLTELGGTNPGDFYVAVNGCNETVLAPGATCTLEIMMIALGGGDRAATLTISSGTVSVTVELKGQGRFIPQLLPSPAAITTNGITTIIGRGFPPGETFAVKVGDTGEVLSGTADELGMFRIPYSAFGKLGLGNYVLTVDAVPTVFEVVRGQLVVVLPTFQPQGPGGPAFGEALIVTRGGGS